MTKQVCTMHNPSILVVFVIVLMGIALTCPPPTLPPNATWVSDKNCTHGNVYQTLSPPQKKCRCWGRCGYICEPVNSTSTTATTTTTAKTSPCPNGGVWVNPQGERCYCQTYNKQSYYVCEPTTTPAP